MHQRLLSRMDWPFIMLYGGEQIDRLQYCINIAQAKAMLSAFEWSSAVNPVGEHNSPTLKLLFVSHVVHYIPRSSDHLNPNSLAIVIYKSDKCHLKPPRTVWSLCWKRRAQRVPEGKFVFCLFLDN